MKRKMLILVFLLFGIMLAGNVQIIAQESIKLDLFQAVEMALSNNLELQKSASQLENAKIDYTKSESENLLSQSSLLKQQAELQLAQEKEQLQQQKEDIIIQAVDEYLHLNLAQKDLQLKEKELELEKNILDEIKTQVKAGYKVELDILEQNTEYFDALFSLENAKLEYLQLLESFRMTLGLASNIKFEIMAFDLSDFKEIDLQKVLQEGRKNSKELQIKSLKIDLASQELEKSKVSDTPEIDLNKLENNLAIAKLDYLIVQQNLDYQIQSQWQNYVQTKNDIILSQNSLNQIKENKIIISNQVKAGLVSEDEELSAIIGVLEAEYRRVSSVRNYYNALLNLQSIMGNLNKGDIL